MASRMRVLVLIAVAFIGTGVFAGRTVWKPLNERTNELRGEVSTAPPRALPKRVRPKAYLERAPYVQFPRSVDSNAPSFWWDSQYFQILSHNFPHLSAGPNVERLGPAELAPFQGEAPRGFQWIESIHIQDGVIWGLYHLELHTPCPGRPYFTVPEIGLAKSEDQGRTWIDKGIILRDNVEDTSCESSPNDYFSGGVGDPNWIVHEEEGAAYIFYSSYSGTEAAEQGIHMARLALADFENPVGQVWRWTSEGFTEPGIEGRGTPILPARKAWHLPDADAFWGPSIHWNTYLNQHVILLNRAKNKKWDQEGVYLVYADDIRNPATWTHPQKLLNGGRWYPQVIGDPSLGGTAALAGKKSRFFMRGISSHFLVFK